MSPSRPLVTEIANSNLTSFAPPSPAPSAQLVSLALLEATHPPLLVRFLRPFEAYLAARAVDLESVAGDANGLVALYAVLTAVDRAMPVALQQALVDVAELATDAAHEHVLGMVRSAQLGLFETSARTTREDLAFQVYLDHPELFRSAHARTQSTEVRRFVEFVARDPTPIEGATLTARRLQLGGLISAYFRERNRTGYCDLRVSETDLETTFVVIHGRPPRNHGAIESDECRTRVAYVPDKHDTLVIDHRTGRLAVNAQYPREQDFYRSAIGRVFWNDAEHFGAEPVFTGEPLRFEGREALGTHGVPGVRDVVLRELKLSARDDTGLALTLKARDLQVLLASDTGRAILELGDVVGFKLALVLAGKTRPVQVEVEVPNHLSFDRRVSGEIVREYLLEAGLMRIPAMSEPHREVG
jgi:hypothetical protein